MHVLISCVGSAGDVHPFMAIGQALRRRGHEVEVLASPHFQPRIEAAGLGFVPFGTEADYQRIIQQAALWDPVKSFPLMWREMQPRLVAAHGALVARAQPGRTVLVGSTLAWHVRLAQETHGLPGATVHLSPLCLFSATAPAQPPVFGDLTRWPTSLVRALHWVLEHALIDKLIAPGLDAIRSHLQLPRVRRVMSHWINSPQRVVCAWPDWYGPAQADWPGQTVTTGFARWQAGLGGTLDPALSDFLADGLPPVGLTPGSAMAHGKAFFERGLQACGDLGLRAVLVTPYADQLPQPLPRFAHAVNYAPFDLLLPRLRALVHHGGVGTTAQALAAGLPQGLVPFAHDQFDNAMRVVKLGVGLRLNLRKPRNEWAAALSRLTSDPQMASACAHHASLMGHADAAPDHIASVIEGLMPSRAPLAA